MHTHSLTHLKCIWWMNSREFRRNKFLHFPSLPTDAFIALPWSVDSSRLFFSCNNNANTLHIPFWRTPNKTTVMCHTILLTFFTSSQLGYIGGMVQPDEKQRGGSYHLIFFFFLPPIFIFDDKERWWMPKHIWVYCSWGFFCFFTLKLSLAHKTIPSPPLLPLPSPLQPPYLISSVSFVTWFLYYVIL